MIAPLLFGLIGTAILLALGVWQLQRLAWKEGVLAEIEARISTPPVPVPDTPDPVADRYLPVATAGTPTGPELHVLTSRKAAGPGYRVISAFELGERRILVDLGFVAEAEKDAPRPSKEIDLTGNLVWPNETDPWFTPEPNLDRNIWFARDVEKMAAHLDTEPVMVAVRQVSPDLPTRPMPVTIDVPNDHLGYAITWFSLAAIWIGMTAYLLWRIKRADT